MIVYSIRVEGYRDSRWPACCAGLTITDHRDGSATLRGPLADVATLRRVLLALSACGLGGAHRAPHTALRRPCLIDSAARRDSVRSKMTLACCQHTHRNAHPSQHVNRDTDQHCHRNCSANLSAHRDANLNEHTPCYSNRHANGNSDRDSHCRADCDSLFHAHLHRDAVADDNWHGNTAADTSIVLR